MNEEGLNDSYLYIYKCEVEQYIERMEHKYEYTEEFPSEYDLFIMDGNKQYASRPLAIFIKNRPSHTRKMQPYTARSKIG